MFPCYISNQQGAEEAGLALARSTGRHFGGWNRYCCHNHSANRRGTRRELPRARFQHVTDMLKEHKGKAGRIPNNIILSIGLDDRNSDPNKTFTTWIRTRYHTIKVRLVEINYNKTLPMAEQFNIYCINRAMLQIQDVTIIPKLEQRLFKVTSGIQWSNETADTLIRHWISYLN